MSITIHTQAFGESFLQPDIQLFRLNLIALESLNEKYLLYRKALFRTELHERFMSVLLQVS